MDCDFWLVRLRTPNFNDIKIPYLNYSVYIVRFAGSFCQTLTARLRYSYDYTITLNICPNKQNKAKTNCRFLINTLDNKIFAIIMTE